MAGMWIKGVRRKKVSVTDEPSMWGLAETALGDAKLGIANADRLDALSQEAHEEAIVLLPLAGADESERCIEIADSLAKAAQELRSHNN